MHLIILLWRQIEIKNVISFISIIWYDSDNIIEIRILEVLGLVSNFLK